MIKLKNQGSSHGDIIGLAPQRMYVALHSLGYWKVSINDVHPYWVELDHKRKFKLDIRLKDDLATEDKIIQVAKDMLRLFDEEKLMAISISETPEMTIKFHRYDV